MSMHNNNDFCPPRRIRMFLFEDSCDIVVLRTGDGQRCWCHSLAAREGTPRIEECFPVVGEARPTSRRENPSYRVGRGIRVLHRDSRLEFNFVAGDLIAGVEVCALVLKTFRSVKTWGGHSLVQQNTGMEGFGNTSRCIVTRRLRLSIPVVGSSLWSCVWGESQSQGSDQPTN